MRYSSVFLALLASLSLHAAGEAITLAAPAAPPSALTPVLRPRVHLRWGTAAPGPRVRSRVAALLAQRAELSSSTAAEPCDKACAQSDLRLEVGLNAPAADLGKEGFQLQIVAPTRAEPNAPPAPLRLSITGQQQGLLYGSYAALEALGYRFWHPLQPVTPPQLDLYALARRAPQIERPHLEARGLVHHTMHPLELTHVLNGWGPQGPSDAAGWEALLPEWEGYLEWLVAQRQNKVEWVLLEKSPWAAFARSEERLQRLRRLTDLAADWQIKAGIDAPLALQQQNGWRLIREPGNTADEHAQLRSSLDWLARTGADFISTEMGFSEFHHGGSAGMLDWLNTATAHLADQHQLPFYTKVHISSGQTTADYRDPDTGGPLNYNFLPDHADPRLGIMPHTVQIYSLDDPAPTYGRQDFSEMHRFIRRTAGTRPTLWFPETSYWVNYDIHVPLFLPVYAQRRIHDLQLLDDVPLQGQILFSSGWEWGYWLNDLLAARAAWDHGLSAGQRPSEAQADAQLRRQLQDTLAPFGSQSAAWSDLIADAAQTQHALLVKGEVNGRRPRQITENTGMAYLAGQDAWSELGGWIRRFGLKGYQTQPDRLGLLDVRNADAAASRYGSEVRPLLEAMETQFAALARRSASLASGAPEHLQAYAQEFDDGLAITALRARFVRSLYEHALQAHWGNTGSAARWLTDAEASLDQAQSIATRRTAAYRADPARLAGWDQDNPTAYRYGYLAPAKELFYWRRDLAQLTQNNANPCLYNIIDPLEVALPEPGSDWRARLGRALTPLTPLRDCLNPPGLARDTQEERP